MTAEMLVRHDRSVGSARGGNRPLVHVIVIAGGLAMIYPLLWLVSSSFKPTRLVFTRPSIWSGMQTIENYKEGWSALGLPFSQFFVNSIAIAALSVVGNLLSCSLAAYSFARLEFRFRKLFFTVMLGTIMLPFNVVIVPQYILFHYLGWINTFYPLIAPKFLAVDSFFIFLMVQFIRSLPRDLDDAARVDGCGFFGVYWRIILPLMRPAMAVSAVFTFIWSWNDFFIPLLYLTDQNVYTVPVALNAFLDSTGQSEWGPMFAMSTLSLVPVFIVFLVAQRHLIQGIATTGIK